MEEAESDPLLPQQSFVRLETSVRRTPRSAKLLRHRSSVLVQEKEKFLDQKHGHLVYSPHSLTSWAVFRQLRHTVFEDTRIWFVAGALMMLALTVAAAVHYLVPRPENLDTQTMYLLIVYFEVFIAFMVGIYMKSCLARWWSSVTALMDFILLAQKLTWVLVCTGVRGELRAAMQRLAILSLHLLENEVTTTWEGDEEALAAKWDQMEAFLLVRGIGHHEELEELSKVGSGHRAEACWVWIGRHASQLQVSPPMRAYYMGVIAQALDAIKNIKLFQRAQMPYMYAHMLAMMVHLNNITLAIAGGVVIAAKVGVVLESIKLLARRSVGKDLPTQAEPTHEMYAAVTTIVVHLLAVFIQPLIYQAFLEIAGTLNDPYGHVEYSVPLHTYIEEMRALIAESTTLAEMAEEEKPPKEAQAAA